jgi:hypothetical protein
MVLSSAGSPLFSSLSVRIHSVVAAGLLTEVLLRFKPLLMAVPDRGVGGTAQSAAFSLNVSTLVSTPSSTFQSTNALYNRAIDKQTQPPLLWLPLVFYCSQHARDGNSVCTSMSPYIALSWKYAHTEKCVVLCLLQVPHSQPD